MAHPCPGNSGMRLAGIFKWNRLDDLGLVRLALKLSRPDGKNAMSKPKVCSNCGGGEIEYDAGRGDAVCTSCGSVLEEDIIVSEVSFQEQSSGASSVVGQFVSSEGGKAPLSGTGFHHGMGKDSREVTLQQAKRRLTQLGNMLKLNQHCIDTAFMFFKMALQLNLTRGRKSSIIDTACLYLVCRSEGTPHLLLDFSDVLQINVYALGRAYLKLSNALHINPPAIDPCLYIHRFAHKLELGDKTHEVSMTALRLVARMKRDWIHHGRRPAGLCGAALLVSARLHNFNRSVKEVARVVKLSDGTIRKRLGDFRDTPSSRLTIDEFLKIDLEQEHDPPSFTEAKKRAKHHQVAGEADQSKDRKEGDGADSDNDLELGTEGGGGGGGGFGGIRMSSVQEVIAKARFDEAFNIAPTVGLSNDLEELARLVGEEQQEEEEKSPLDENSKEGELSLEGIDDQEIDNMLLSEEEVKIKTQLWFAENADFLKEQEERRQRLAAIKATKGDKPKRRVNRRKQKAPYQPANTAGEAIERMLVEKKISSKINYDVLRDLDKGLSSNGSTVAGSSTTMLQADEALTGDSSLTGLSNSAVVPPVTTGFTLPLIIKRSPSSGSSGRLPSLSTRKRTFTSLSGLSAPGTQPTKKFSRANSPLDIKLPIPTPETDSVLQASSESPRTASPSNQRTNMPLGRTEVVSNHHSMKFGLTGSGDSISVDLNPPLKVPEVIEESGPVQYCEEDVEEEGLDDEDMDELAYEGDPLMLNSDYEEEAGDHYYEDYDN